MFDNLKVPPALAQLFDPPLDVWVHLPEIYRGWLEDPRDMDPPPGWLIEQKGLVLPRKLPGVQYARLRVRQGTWFKLVSYSLPTELGIGPIRVRHLIPDKAATRRWPEHEGEPF